ncbi:hypothetical protein C8R43DRAFT_1128299 [Mycena crocata]|nr:hypothetical protein C8R43DRAFT_1128299 [Mycena crocata]
MRPSSSPPQTARSSAAHSNRLWGAPFLDTRLAVTVEERMQMGLDSEYLVCPRRRANPAQRHTDDARIDAIF